MDYFQSSNTTTIYSDGGTINLSEDDITIVFPDGFISQPSVTFRHYVIPHEFISPHSFPQGFRPISAILLLEPREQIQFLKPIEITMPHFVDLETEDDCKRIAFFKACTDDYEIINGQTIVKFKEVSNDMAVSLFTTRFMDSDNIERRIQYATLYAGCCCYICSVENMTSEDTNKAKFCLTQAVSRFSNEVTLHYIIHYDLTTCLKVKIFCFLRTLSWQQT